jgi:hypothetical protein
MKAVYYRINILFLQHFMFQREQTVGFSAKQFRIGREITPLVPRRHVCAAYTRKFVENSFLQKSQFCFLGGLLLRISDLISTCQKIGNSKGLRGAPLSRGKTSEKKSKSKIHL